MENTINSEIQAGISPTLTGGYQQGASNDENQGHASFTGRAVRTMEVDSKLMHTTAAQALQGFYTDDKIYKAIYLYKLANANTDFSAADLLAIIMGDNFANTPQPKEVIYRNADEEMTEDEINAMRRENQEIKDRSVCGICCVNRIDIAFHPCGHLYACSTCSPKVKDCPVCRVFIRNVHIIAATQTPAKP